MSNPVIASAVYFSELLIAYIFCGNMTEKRYSFGISMVIGSLIFGAGALLNILGESNYVLNACSMVTIHFLFILICFHLDIPTAAFYTMVLCGLSTALEFGTVSVISTLTEGKFTDINHDVMLLTVEILICKSLYFLFSLLLLKILRFLKTGSQEKEWMHFPLNTTVQPLLTLMIILVFYYICIQEEISRQSQSLFSLICVAALGATIFLVLHNMGQMKKEQEYMQMQSEYRRLQTEKAYYDILDQQNQQLRMFAHDTRNHLAAIQSLNKDPKIAEYVAALSGSLESYSHSCQSGNVLLDVILGKYTLECQRQGIRFDYNVAVDNLKDVEDMDLVSILGNLLDNALEAAGKTREKKVSLETICRNGYRVLIIRNSSMPPREADGTLLTSKPEGWNHGFGLRSVRKTLKKYQGDLQWDYDRSAEQFTMTVMIGKNK